MRRRQQVDKSGQVTLATLARHLRLTTGTVSCVLNNPHGAKNIPQHTKDRVFALAAELNYQPNFFARSLRKRKSYTLGVMASDIGDPLVAPVLAGIERILCERGYFFLLSAHNGDAHLLEMRSKAMLQRGIEGLIIIGMETTHSFAPPAVAIALPKDLCNKSFEAVHAIGSTTASLARPSLESHGAAAAMNLLQLIETKPKSLKSTRRPSHEKANPTIADIADAAGVSIATVSYALNGSSPVSAETVAAIQKIANDYQYKPNTEAVKLGRRGRGRSRRGKSEKNTENTNRIVPGYSSSTDDFSAPTPE